MFNFGSVSDSVLLKLVRLVGDTLVCLLAIYLVFQSAFAIWYHYWAPFSEFYELLQQSMYAVIMYVLLTVVLLRVYDTSVFTVRFSVAMRNTLLALVISNILFVVYSYIRQENFFIQPNDYVFLIIVYQLVFFVLIKVISFFVIRRYALEKALLISSCEKEARIIGAKFFIDNKSYRQLEKILIVDKEAQSLCAGAKEAIAKADLIYLDATLNRPIKDAVFSLAIFDSYKKVFIVPKKYEIAEMRSLAANVDDTLVLSISDMHISIEKRFYKRTLDLLVSIIALVILAIPMLFVALIIKVQDKGPVLYKQTRIKRDNKTFEILKFRSMTHIQTKEDEQQKATANDARITKFGRFIRATRIDELPQLLNVLKGDMTLVGPRPLMESDLTKASMTDNQYRFRTNAKPGLTGLAQIYGRNDSSLEDRLVYDLYYIRRCSFFLDFKILCQTVLVLFSKRAGLGDEKQITLEDILAKENKKLIISEHEKYNEYAIVQIEDAELFKNGPKN